LDALDKAITGTHGGDHKSEAYQEIKHNNVMLDSEDSVAVDQGNSERYALRRLRNKCDDLHKRVLAGELIPNPEVAFPYSLSPWERVGVRARLGRRTPGPDPIAVPTRR